MTRILTSAAVVAGTMALGLLIAGPGLARDLHQPERDHEHGYHNGDHDARRDHEHHHDRRHFHHRRHHRHVASNYGYFYAGAGAVAATLGGYGAYGYGGSQGYEADYAPRCQPVSKYGYDSYGRPAHIGGTMCFDQYGQGYVVPGSRFIISRY